MARIGEEFHHRGTEGTEKKVTGEEMRMSVDWIETGRDEHDQLRAKSAIRMKQIYFFALRDDILPVLEMAERDNPLQYVRTGNRTSPDFETFRRGADIPNLGSADFHLGIGCDTFVVAPATTSLTIESRIGVGGVQRYLMDQLHNPDTVTFTPAGMWSEDIVLNGRVATVSDTEVAQALMKRFNSAFNKVFTRVRAFRVGPQALELLKNGKRLAGSAQSPREYDLKIGP